MNQADGQQPQHSNQSESSGATGVAGGEPPVTFASVATRLGPAGPLAVAWAVLPALGGFALLYKAETVGSWLRGHGSEGVVIYAALFMVLSGFALLPTYASAILGGWAFGFAQGFPAALVGFGGGSVIGYFVARTAAKNRVVKLIEEHEKWRVVRDALIGGSDAGRRGAVHGGGSGGGAALAGEPPVAQAGHGFWKMLGVVALLRLPPNSPFAITNLVMASVGVRFVPFVLGTLIGMAPRTAAAVYIATTLHGLTKAEIKHSTPAWMMAVGIGVMLVVLGILGAIAQRALKKVAGPPMAKSG